MYAAVACTHNPVVQVRSADDNGTTALMIATELSFEDCFRLLLVHNPAGQETAAEKDGYTALIIVVQKGHAVVA